MSFNQKKKNISYWVYVLLAIQFSVYIVFAIYGEKSQISDGKTYIKILENLYLNGGIYPNNVTINNNYINNPGAVNIYLLFFKIFNTLNIRVLFVLNAFFITLGNLLLLMLLNKLNSNNKTLLLFVGLTSFYFTNLGLVNTITSDTSAYLLSSITLLLVFSLFKNRRSNLGFLLFVGLFLAVFDYIRSVGLIVFCSVILTYVYCYFLGQNKLHYRNKRVFLNLFLITLGYVGGKICIGGFHEYKTGYRISGSVSLGYNFLMGTGKDSDGTWRGGVFNKGGKGYAESIEYQSAVEKNSLWVRQSIDSVFKEPIFHLTLGLKKVFITFSYDFLALEKLSSPKVKYFSMYELVKYKDISIYNFLLLLTNNFIYGFILVNGVIRMLDILKRRSSFVFNEFEFYLLLFFALYMFMIFLIIGAARYHHVLMPVLFICALFPFGERKKV
jgi:hypothetical protein